jgi:hypothetical protein
LFTKPIPRNGLAFNDKDFNRQDDMFTSELPRSFVDTSRTTEDATRASLFRLELFYSFGDTLLHKMSTYHPNESQ